MHFLTVVGIFISKTNAAISSKKLISFLNRNQPYFNDWTIKWNLTAFFERKETNLVQSGKFLQHRINHSHIITRLLNLIEKRNLFGLINQFFQKLLFTNESSNESLLPFFRKEKPTDFNKLSFFYGKTHFPYNERRNESWLLFRKRKKPVYINLLVLKEGNWFFEVLRIQRKKKQMKVSESNSKVVCVSQGVGAKRYFQSETD